MRTPEIVARIVLRSAFLAAAAFALVAPSPPPAEAANSPCAGARFRSALEWERSSRPIIRVRGPLGIPELRVGTTFILSGVTSIAGKRRRGFAAIDLRSGRPTAFDPPGPRGRSLTAMTASPSAMYLAHESFDDAPFGEKEIDAFDLRTGAPLPAFDPPDFRVGRLAGMVFAGGRVVMGGAPPFGPGITLGAYDAATGARVWQAPAEWPVRSLATDGASVFAEVPVEEGPPHLVAAFSAADGTAIPGWGATLPDRGYRAPIDGADAARVYILAGRRVSDLRPFVVSARDGRPVVLPRLPSNASTLRPGAGNTLLGTLRVRPRRGGPAVHIDAVFRSDGRLIGTVPASCRVLAARDARHLLVTTTNESGGARIFELVRPRS